MKLLLDTHAFLWFVRSHPMLSRDAEAAICNPENEVLLSAASYWEIAIKVGLNKLGLDEPFSPFIERMIDENRLSVLPILVRHASVVTSLPLHHRDPFDRMLIAQAIAEDVPIVGADSAFDAYSVKRLW